MKKFLITCFTAMMVIACGGSGGEKSSSAVAKVDGAKIYKTNCTLCHGDNGKLGLNNSKDLTVSKLTMAERVDIITNGKNTMVGFSALLDKDEIKAVAEYTFTLK